MDYKSRQPLYDIESLARSLGLLIQFGTNTKYVYRKNKNNSQGYAVIQCSPFDLVWAPERIFIRLERDIAHEIGHYLLASDKQRKKTDYGIPNFETRKSNKNWDVNDLKAMLIERFIIESMGTGRKVCQNHEQRMKSAVFDKKNFDKSYHKAMTWWEKEGEQMMKDLLAKFDYKKKKKNEEQKAV